MGSPFTGPIWHRALRESVLSKIDNATAKSAPSESNIRFILDILLVYAHDIAMSENPARRHASSVQTEKHWAYGPVKWNKKDYRLVGKPDYAVWYGEVEETALNVVVVEAKKRHMAGNGLIQCLGYMGVGHRIRKASGKENCTVYRMASDDQTFIFLKINEKSEWSERQFTTRTQQYSPVLGLLVHFMRTAANISPTHFKQSLKQSHMKENSDSTTQATLYSSFDEMEVEY